MEEVLRGLLHLVLQPFPADSGLGILCGTRFSLSDTDTRTCLKPVFSGDTVTAKLEVTAIDPEKRFVTCSTECLNQHAGRRRTHRRSHGVAG